MSYHDEVKREMILKLRKKVLELPSFCSIYFQGIENSTAERTRLGYASDLNIFFNYLLEFLPQLQGKTIHDLELSDMETVTPSDIEGFLTYVSYYSRPASPSVAAKTPAQKEAAKNKVKEEEFQNGEKGKSRKLAAVRSMYNYFYKKEMINGNPAMLVSTPKIHDKTIIRLEPGEIARLLDEVESGDKLTERQKKYHEFTKTRDIALITTLLGTGMRISECVGLDIKNIDFDENGLKITRKGGNEAIVYFGAEVRRALKNYLVERNQIEAMPGDENALFLSMQKKRLSVRAIQNLVDKYAKIITPLKHISPHKLRSTYGTELYNSTGDIYLVADVLGHKDVNTTRKHYAHIEEEHKRQAAEAVKLRED